MIHQTARGTIRSNNKTCCKNCDFLIDWFGKRYTCLAFHVMLETKKGKPRVCDGCRELAKTQKNTT